MKPQYRAARADERARMQGVAARRVSIVAQLVVAVALGAGALLLPVPFMPNGAALGEATAGATGRVEFVAKRSETSKTFRNDDGTLTTELYAEPIHYRGGDGSWREISSHLVPADVRGYALRNEGAAFEALFKSELGAGFLRFSAGGKAFDFALEGAARTRVRATQRSVSYDGVFPGVDLGYVVSADGVKETLTLDAAALQSRFRFTMAPPEGVRVEADERADGSWAFHVAAQPDPLFVLAPPTAVDASGVRASARDVSLDVRRDGARFVIDLAVSDAWLRSRARKFPVVVDPTITIQSTSQYGNFNFNCATCLPLVDERVRIGSSGTEIWRPALQFSLSAIPAGAAVSNAKLKLYYDGKCILACVAGTHRLDLHRLTTAWSTASTSAAVQFDAAVASTVNFSTVADADVQWLTWDVTSLVNGWRAGTYQNNGVLLKRNPDPLSSNGPTAPSGRYLAEASLKPKLEVTYTGDTVNLLPITSTHSNGADLEWTRFTGESGNAFSKYEVHRGTAANFPISSASRLATIGDRDITTYRDTTASPSKTFYYKVVANSSASNERSAKLNGPGNASKTLQPAAAAAKATTISYQPGVTQCANDGGDDDLWLAADSTAIRRALLHFDLRDIPSDASIIAARLDVWRPFMAGVTATVDAHRVTRAWEEGTGIASCTGDGATWYETESGVKWSANGGDYDPAVVDWETTDTSGDWDPYYLQDLVAKWVKGEAPNHGVMLKLRDETQVDGKRFRYYADDFAIAPTLAPKLYLVYTDGSKAIAPTTSVAAPAPGALVGGTAVKVDAAATDDRRVERVELYIDGGPMPVGTDTAQPFSFTWDTTALTNADHVLTVKATDDAGNVTTSSGTTVKVENSAPPSASLSAPAAGATVSGSAVAVTATATGGRLISRVEFYADGVRFAEDTTAPYEATWNTLDAALPAYDGSHTLAAKAYDTLEREASSTDRTVTVANTVNTKFVAALSSTEFPQAVLYDPAASTQDKYGLEVTVTNNGSAAWAASDVVLRYRWYSPDVEPVVTEGLTEVGLGTDLPAGQSRVLRVLVEPPALAETVSKAQYRLRVDLFSKASAAWFAEKGNKPLENPVIVNKALVRGAIGFEPYYQFVGEQLGAGMRHEVNVANGNSLVQWTPFSAPGRGLDTVLTLTHNALEKKCECPAGNNFSLGISSLTRFGNPIDVHPNKADEIAGRSNKYIENTDVDGTTHRFTSNDGITYQEPDGVHLFLRRYSTTDAARKWALTTPDRVTYFYDSDGYPTFVEDRNGNKLTFTIEATPPAEDPGGPKRRITKLTDAGGRDFTITYWAKADKVKSHVRGKVKRITDHSGSPLDFEYYEDGNLRKLIQRGGTNADGSFLADRWFVFTYTTSSGDGPAIPLAANRVDPDPRTPNQSTRLYSVRDPRGNETLFTYLGPGHGEDRWKLASRTDRAGAVTSYAYDIVNRVTTVTLPLSRVWKYGYDVEGKATSITNPLNQTTTQAWSDDRMLTKVTEPTGKYVEFAYNANGRKIAEWDQLRNRTSYEYEDVTVKNADGSTTDVAANWTVGRNIPHISQLSKLTTPKGTATSTPTNDFQASYAYDPKGNLVTITDPEGFVTRHTYSADGMLASTTDANSHTTTYVSYDANGLATEIRDAKGRTTRHSYDADGLLRSTQDPLHASDTGTNDREYKTVFDYDSFHRLGATSAPKSTKEARGMLIWTATAFDPNDNVTSKASPANIPGGGARTTYTYDAVDRQTAEVGPDRSTGEERSEFAYDAAGRLTRATLPLGVASTAVANDYVTETSYDLLDRTTKETRYPKDGTATDARVTHYCYDLAGDLRSITAPRGARSDAPTPFTSCPADSAPTNYVYTPASYTTKYAYDDAHRLANTIDPLGNTSSVTHDANGNLASETDGEGNTERHGYDDRDELVQEERPFDPSRPTRKLVAIYERDGVGNVVREISPRAVDSQGAGPYTNYVTTYVYDAVDQLTTIKHPVDAGTRQAWTHYGYDANGNVLSVSLPVDTDNAALVGSRQQTRTTYYDTGWIRTLDYPDSGVITFDYSAQGWQTSRSPAGRPEETWTYYDDGELRENIDPNGHPNKFAYDLNNNLIRTDDATGVDDPAESPLTTEQVYNGFDEPIELRQRKEPPGQVPPPWRVTIFAYNANGNIQERVDEGRTQTFGYDQADRFTSQVDANGAGCGDDRQLTISYLRNGWRAGEVIRKSDGGCITAAWPIKRQSSWTYFANGNLKTLESWKGEQGAANLIESHTLDYESGGVYLNGHRVKDTFTLQGPGTAPCRTSSCSATFAYDARERLTEWTNGLPGADASSIAHTLDPNTTGVDTLEGNVVREVVSGAGARTRDYTYSPAGQLLTLSVNGTLAQRYFWDVRSGNIRCVTEPGYSDSTCTEPAGLRDWYKFDPLDRLRVFKSYRTNATVDSSYVYDAFDRLSTEAEAHNGGPTRTTQFTYLALSGEISSETQRAASTTTKRYAYDVDDERVGVAVTTSSTQDLSFARNPRGDVSLLVDDAGSVTASYAYKPYGDLDTSVSRNDIDKTNPFNAFRFNNKRFDSGSRSIDMGARRYEPDDGRFLEQDFLREADADRELSLDQNAQNRYGFAGGNPVSFIELDGHQTGLPGTCRTIGAFARPRVYSFAYLNPEDFPGFAFRIAFDIRMTQVRMPNLTCRNSDRWRTSYYAIYDATSLARPFHPTLKLGWIVEMQNTISKRRDFGKIIAQVKIDDPGAKWPSSTGGRTTWRTGSPTWVPRWVHFAVTLESDIWIWPPWRRTTCPLRPRAPGPEVRPINAPPQPHVC